MVLQYALKVALPVAYYSRKEKRCHAVDITGNCPRLPASYTSPTIMKHSSLASWPIATRIIRCPKQAGADETRFLADLLSWQHGMGLTGGLCGMWGRMHCQLLTRVRATPQYDPMG